MTPGGKKRGQQARKRLTPYAKLFRSVLCSTLVLATSAPAPVFAKSKSDGNPAGTMLLPITPKIAPSKSDAESATTKQASTDTAALEDTAPAPYSAPVGEKATAAYSASQGAGAAPAGTMLVPMTPKISQQSNSTQKASAKDTNPSGTMLLPMTPKIDTTKAPPKATPRFDEEISAQGTAAPPGAERLQDPMKGMPSVISPEKGHIDQGLSDAIEDDTTLKGTVSIVADDTEYDQNKNVFLGTGNAVAVIAGQDSKLEADMILYDQNDQTIDARGNVRIFRNGQLTTGSAFKFNVTSDEYLITSPDTEVQGSQVIARKGYGSNSGMVFKDGTLSLPEPIYISRNAMWGPISYKESIGEKTTHPDAYLPPKQGFKFTARKMVYEKYKEAGNLTVFGGKMMFGKFGVPLGKFNATVGGYNSRVTFPVTPMIGNNLQVGGLNIGPNFNTAIGKSSQLSWAPLIQLGGRNLDNTGSTQAGKLGLGGQVGFTTDRLSTHIAYGTVSNLLVADFKYRINKSMKLQTGINRYMDDGMYGYRRARIMAEVVDNHALGNLPFIASLNFRTSAGYAQDNPNLVNLSPDYAKLFGSAAKTDTKVTSGFRLQEQITASSKPIFHIGNEKYGLKSFMYGGLGLSAYSSGDARIMGQMGPVVDLHADRFRLQTGYTQSLVRGSSPFLFDQFIQGTRSTFVTGDVRVNKYLTIGGTIGYNLVQKLSYGKTITAAIGPEDFKLLLSRDMIRGTNRVGFDVLYGAPINYNKLVLKGQSDSGQLGGI